MSHVNAFDYGFEIGLVNEEHGRRGDFRRLHHQWCGVATKPAVIIRHIFWCPVVHVLLVHQRSYDRRASTLATIGRRRPGSQPGGVPDGRDDGLGLEVVAEGVDALLPADAAHLVAAERDARVEHVVAVHPHRAHPQRPGQRVRRVQAPREHPRRQPVLRSVRPPDHLLHAAASAWLAPSADTLRATK
jgi:hypothetical protein